MSLDTLIATIEEVTNEEIEDTLVEAPAPIELTISSSGKVTTKKKGRPGVHTMEGRVYFLKEEIETIRQDPNAFVEWMNTTYGLSDERKAELLNNKVNVESDTVSYTLHGPILEVLAKAEEIVKLYPDREVIFEVSKQRLVAPTSSSYLPPTTKVVHINNKTYTSIVSQEFNPSIIYVYLTVK